jgi:5-methylcytosine-specific restriction protein A
MPTAPLKPCTQPGCPELTTGGRCPAHQTAAQRQRGSASDRGYGHTHRTTFREAVLAKNPICVLCHRAPSTEADHHPHSRKQLITQGKDPSDPRYGRGLCHKCHSQATAQHHPGGWNAPQ